jgi:hypothetical protein
MGINAQMRRGLARLQALDNDTGTITRKVYADNGRGGLIPTGETLPPISVTCRVSYEGGGVWHRGEWVGGLATDATPCVFASPEADIKAEDILEWRGKRYKVGAVTYPHLGGGAVTLQAPLTEVE